LIEHAQVIHKGDENGNEMVVRFRLPSGLEIFGLPTKNSYGGHWDLGPTWNYVVLADRPFLVDAGRFGQGNQLLAMMESIGIKSEDLEFVLISHGHEDHDGGLEELVGATHLNVKAHAMPGHSPDCLAVRLGEEAIIVGDIILPDISPWPTRKSLFGEVAEVIKPDYTDAGAIFGLHRYIKSLKNLIEIAGRHPELIVLPGHRQYYNGCWNEINLEYRSKELIAHHIERCGAIIEILNDGPKKAEEIATAHFEERLLAGFGNIMAANEIVSHCELLIECGDVTPVNPNAYAATGSRQFETYIQDLKTD
jgi:glyoxylase-like metal-dependent hydrolase (beta-lactamase superfamily II)